MRREEKEKERSLYSLRPREKETEAEFLRKCRFLSPGGRKGGEGKEKKGKERRRTRTSFLRCYGEEEDKKRG